jgi:MOSC domain-containing protein YiiM
LPEPAASIVSVNVGEPADLEFNGRTYRTAFLKKPVVGAVAVGRLGLAGDRQVHRRVHGGPDKALYAYPVEHYEFWLAELGEFWLAELGLDSLPWGSFGENLSVRGLREDELRIGDLLRMGTAVLRITEPRLPCKGMAFRFRREDMVDRFTQAARSGFYLAVEEEGLVQAGDAIERVGRDDAATVIEDFAARLRRRT